MLLAILVLTPCLAWSQGRDGDVASTADDAVLTLAAALERVERENPRLRAFVWELEAAQARVLQARLRPNPELALEVEDFRLGGGSGGAAWEQEFGLDLENGGFDAGISRTREPDGPSGLSGAEITLSLAQVVELGGKRARRVKAATAEEETVAREYEVLRADVLAAAVVAFIDVLAVEADLAVSREVLRVLTESEAAIALRVEAGKVSPLELKKIRIERENQRIDEERTAARLQAARLALAAFWGAPQADFSAVAGDLAGITPVAPLDQLQARVMENPDLLRWSAQAQVELAKVALRRAEAVPNVTVRLGVRSTALDAGGERGWRLSTDAAVFTRTRDDDGRTESLVFEVGLPLPLFNRNQGAILEAEHLARRADAEAGAVTAEVNNDLARLHGELEAVRKQLEALGQGVIPLASAALEGARLGYQEGKFGILDLIDAERTFASVRQQRTAAQAEWHRLRVQLERLIGAPMAGEAGDQEDEMDESDGTPEAGGQREDLNHEE
ncbi:MAG: TolC family protein [Candidatus Hydrogenedentes bacterium]|nr:TolC family protein [Candidatus Hydrogenedentota bacterium]